jgi:hypothetical protein
MTISPRRPTLSPPVTRHFEFTRLRDQLIALAYQALIKNKSTASGGETLKGSAVFGVYLSHRDLGHMNGTSFGRRLWDRGTRVSAARLDEYPIRRWIHEQAKLQRDEDQGESNFESTQRPLQQAFLIPPVLPVVLICRGKMTSLRGGGLPGSFNLPRELRMSRMALT